MHQAINRHQKGSSQMIAAKISRRQAMHQLKYVGLRRSFEVSADTDQSLMGCVPHHVADQSVAQ